MNIGALLPVCPGWQPWRERHERDWTLVALLVTVLPAVGCTVNNTNGGNSNPSNTCTQSSSVSCSASNETGYVCTGSATPDTSTLDCDDGTPDSANASNTDFCCIPVTATTCSQDSTVQGCVAGSFGFSCTGSDTPDQADSNLDCSTGTPGNNETLYCCTDGTTTTSTCMMDTSVTGCQGGATGYSCTGTDTPDQSDTSLACSTPTANGSSMDYCCITNTSTTCNQDSTVMCQAGSYGFTCTGSDSPAASDTSLTCSTGTANGSNTTYCCTN